MAVLAFEIIDVQSELSVIDQSVEELREQVYIKVTHRSARKRDVVVQAWTTREVDDNT